MKKFNHYLLLSLLVIFSACQKSDLETPEPESGIQDLLNLSIPDGFNFDTDRIIELNITDEEPFVSYEIFGYSSRIGNEVENIAEAFNNMIFSGRPTNGVIRYDLTLSNKFDKVYIARKDGLEYTYEIKNIIDNSVSFTVPYENRSKIKPAGPPNRANRAACPECGNDGIFINGSFEDGNLTIGAEQFPEALVNGWKTTENNGGIDDGTIEIWRTGTLGVTSQSGNFHAEINSKKEAALYQRICTSPGATLEWSVWHRGRAGIDRAEVRIGEFLVNAQVQQIMETDNDAWVEYTGTYVVPALQVDTFFIFEALDTASGDNSIGNFIDNIVIVETIEGDCNGGQNILLYPGGGRKATIGFEDYWGTVGIGDYDFNDTTISYDIEVKCNPDGEVIEIKYTYEVQNTIAGYDNGYALELVGVPEAKILSVTGQKDGHMGLEAGHTNPNNSVIRFFDNSKDWLCQENIISIFVDDVPFVDLGDDVPFNPFLTANTLPENRRIEIHLADEPRTSLGIQVSSVDDADGDYKADAGSTLNDGVTDVENMPWALNIAGEFVECQESIDIFQGYPLFKSWVNSAGVNDSDWFLPANRNDGVLVLPRPCDIP